MLQWFNDLRNPAQKCERVGHKLHTRKRETYRDPESSFRTVVDLCEEEKIVCKRCKHVEKDWEIIYREGYSSVSMPGDMNREWKKNGFVVIQEL